MLFFIKDTSDVGMLLLQRMHRTSKMPISTKDILDVEMLQGPFDRTIIVESISGYVNHIIIIENALGCVSHNVVIENTSRCVNRTIIIESSIDHVNRIVVGGEVSSINYMFSELAE